MREYRLLLVLGFAALLAELAYAILNLSALPMYLKFSLHQEAVLGVIISVFLLTEALSRPAFGALGDKVGRKPLLIAGPAATAVTSYLTVKLEGPFTIPGLIILRAIDGLGSGALWPTAFATIGDIVGEKNRGAALSMLNVTYMSGLALGFLLGGAANEIQGTLSASFYLVSILLGLAVVVLLVFFPSHFPARSERTAPSGHEVDEDIAAGRELEGFRLRALFRSFHEVPEMLVLACVTFLGMGMLTPIVKLYAVEHLGLSETRFGLLVAPVAAAMGIGAVPLGHLGDRYGRCLALCWGLFGCAVAMWVVALFRSTILAAMAVVVIGLGFTISFPAWHALVMSATSPERRGEVIGAVGMAQGLAAIVGASVGAFMYSSDRFSFPRLGVVNYNVPFWTSAILLTVATIVAFTWVRNTHSCKDPAPGVTVRQQKIAVGAAVLTLLCVGAWIAVSYTRPIPPDRVAWCWVQQLVGGKTDRALGFVGAGNRAGWDGVVESKRLGELFRVWKKEREARYVVHGARIISSGLARVRVTFVLAGRETKKLDVYLCRRADGEWKVCNATFVDQDS